MVRFDYGIILIENLKKTDRMTGGFLDAKAVARLHKLSPSLMEKVAQEFKRAGWLESKRGLGGGYKLVENNSEITINDLIRFYRWPARACPLTEKIK